MHSTLQNVSNDLKNFQHSTAAAAKAAQASLKSLSAICETCHMGQVESGTCSAKIDVQV